MKFAVINDLNKIFKRFLWQRQQNPKILWIFSHFLKKSLMEIFILCAVPPISRASKNIMNASFKVSDKSSTANLFITKAIPGAALEKSALKIFAKFTEKQLCRSLSSLSEELQLY